MGDERGPWPGLEQRRQLGPRVVLGDDLGQRADREASGALVEDARRPRRRREQRQPVLGERRRRPQLATGADGVAGVVAQPPQQRPVACRAAVVDEAHEPVEVGPVDQPGEHIVGLRGVVRHERCLDQRPGVAAAALVAGQHAVLGQPRRPPLHRRDLRRGEQLGDVRRHATAHHGDGFELRRA